MKLEPSAMVGLYTTISRMRILSSAAVIECAEKVGDVIAETYLAPKMTPDELRETMKSRTFHWFQYLRDFGKFVARNEERISRNRSKTAKLIASTAIARPQLVEPSPTVTMQRLVPAHALREQQSFKAIDVLDSRGDQHFALAAETATILFLGGGALTIAHTRGSPRLYASSVRTNASPSILSVFGRRRRRDVATEAGSTT